jgi:hypothetical protein
MDEVYLITDLLIYLQKIQSEYPVGLVLRGLNYLDPHKDLSEKLSL